MKSLRRMGCWTTLILIFLLGTFIFLFTQSRQGRNEFSVRHVQRNVTMFGGDVRIEEDERIMGNLLVVGDDLTLEGRIGGNLVVVGGDVDLTGEARVGGNVSVVGGDADVEGASVIDGNVAAVGGDVELAGQSRVGGSVRVVGGRIKQDAAAHVGGDASWHNYTNRVSQENLHTTAPAPLVLTDPPNQPDPPIAQGVDTGRPGERAQARVELLREAAELAEETAEAPPAQAASNRTRWFLVFVGKLVQAFLWTLLITALVLLFNWLLPKQVKAVSRTAEKETALSFATGVIGIVGAAILTAILTITLCFALLALPLLALLALVVLCGWTVTCYWLGHRLDELVAGQSKLSWNPMISVGLSSLVITGVTAFSWVIFPCLGFIAGLLIGSTGTGAAVVHVARGSGRLPGGRLGSGPGDDEAGRLQEDE